MVRSLLLLALGAVGAVAQMYGESYGTPTADANSATVTETLPDGESIVIEVGVTVIGESMGGSSGWTQESQPAMTGGTTHYVRQG
jgi:hypothetical protein